MGEREPFLGGGVLCKDPERKSIHQR